MIPDLVPVQGRYSAAATIWCKEISPRLYCRATAGLESRAPREWMLISSRARRHAPY